MDILQQKLGKDLFNLVLEYCDPIKDPQKERKRVMNMVFKSMSYFSKNVNYSRQYWIRALRQYDENITKRNATIYHTYKPICDPREFNTREILNGMSKRNKGMCPSYIAIIYKSFPVS
jgi:hypothetical protein